MKNIGTNLNAPPIAGDTVRIVFTPSAQSEVYYCWYHKAGFGTSNRGDWQLLADWSRDKNFLTWSPVSDNRHLVVAHVALGASTSNFHQVGLTFETMGAGGNPIQITGMTTTMGDPHPKRTPITLRTRAAGGGGPLYHKYFYRTETGSWNDLGSWDTNRNATLTPPSNGEYTIVVHVSDDPAAADNLFAQAGMTCTIGE